MKRGDIVIITVILVGLLVLIGITSIYQNKEASLVEVRIDGEVVDQFDISINRIQRYETEFGVNVVSIEDGVVKVIESDCLDHICVDTKAATKAGNSIVCVPNRFSVEIIGGDGDVDAISR